MKRLLIITLVLFMTVQAFAQTRGFVNTRKKAKDHIALVIGNSKYPDMPLANPLNDATDVAQSFKDIGFIVETVLDADKEQMAMAIDRFSRKMATAKAAVFYYAGHGMQVDGQNYLIPIARTSAQEISNESQVAYRAINAGEVLSSMESNKVKFAMVVLDACRNNPIKGSGRGKLKGLASIDAPVGSLVMYATKAGDVAGDGNGRNSPFTTAFLQHLMTPGLDVNLLPSKVTNTVHDITGGKQTPGTYIQLTESFTFVPQLTADELDKLRSQQQGKLTELQRRQAEMNMKKQKEDEEMRRKQVELDNLQKQIDDMKNKAATGEGDLDEMLAVVKQREKQKAEYEQLQRQIAEEQRRREEEIHNMKLKEYNTNMEKYNKIANSEFGQDMKPAAWKNVLKNLGITKNIVIGDRSAVKEELGLLENFTVNVAGLNINMRMIEGGSFQMGSNSGDDDEKPVHTVNLGDFAMAKYEVSNKEFCAFLNEKGNQTEGGKEWIQLDESWSGFGRTEKCRIYKSGSTFKVETGYEKHPVIYVSWYAGRAYCKWLSEKTGQNWRLPTEAEWEYAAGNASKHTKYSWGNNSPNGMNGGNVADESAKNKFSDWTIFEGYTDGYVTTAPVGSFNANELGLYDMTGNVWEWCSDWYDGYKSGSQTNPQGASSGSYRVIRGGSWYNNASYCRVTNRNGNSANYRSNVIGFRPCLSL